MKSRNVHLNLRKMAVKMADDNPRKWPSGYERQLGESNAELAMRFEELLRKCRMGCTDSSFRSVFARWL
jgi:hypothetical protein